MTALLVAPMLTGSAPSAAAPSRAELERARDRLMELERDFELVVERYNLVREHLDSLRARIATAQVQVDRIGQRMRLKQQDAVDLATELYKGGSAQAVEALLSSDSINEIDTGLVYLEHTEQAQAELFQSLVVERRLLDREIADLEEQKDRAAVEESRLNDLRTRIEDKIADQQDEIARLNDLIERAEARAARREDRSVPPVTVEIQPAPAPNKAAGKAVEAALSQIGKPYQWAAAGPDSYDCSGLTMWAWAQAGVSLPHNSGAQYAATPRVPRSDWQPGDLLFFGSPIHHVAMYIGNGQMVAAPYTGSQVSIFSAYRSDYVGAGRPGV